MLKNIFASLLLLCVFVGCEVAPATPQFYAYDMEQARQFAGHSDRKILLVVTGEGCAPCEYLKDEVFSGETELFLAEKFVLTFVKYEENTKLVDSLGVNSIPASYILDKTGVVIDNYEGYDNRQEYLTWLKTF